MGLGFFSRLPYVSPNMNVDRIIRYDVFISFHGDETFTHKGRTFTTQDVVRFAVNNRISEKTDNTGISPSIYFDKNHGRKEIRQDTFRALLQTRGGGLGICLLTPKYFRAPWCLAELQLLQHLHQNHDKALELRFVSIGCTEMQIVEDPFVKKVVPNLNETGIKNIGDMSSKEIFASKIANEIWDALSNKNLCTIDVCGNNRRKSFDQVQRLFGMADVGGLRHVFQLHPDQYANVDVTFDQAITSGILSETNISKLSEAILYLSPQPRERRQNAISAYVYKWIISDNEMEWGEDTMDELKEIYLKARSDIDQVIQQERRSGLTDTNEMDLI